MSAALLALGWAVAAAAAAPPPAPTAAPAEPTPVAPAATPAPEPAPQPAPAELAPPIDRVAAIDAAMHELWPPAPGRPDAAKLSELDRLLGTELAERAAATMSPDPLVIAYRAGRGVDALPVARGACRLGDDAACAMTTPLLALAYWRPGSRADAERWMAHACIDGDSESCRTLEALPEGSWAAPLGSACASGASAAACAVLQGAGKLDIVGAAQRRVGFWVMALGTPITAGVGALYGYLLALEIFRVTGSIIGYAVAWAATAGVTAVLTFGIGLAIYLGGGRQLDDAAALAATAPKIALWQDRRDPGPLPMVGSPGLAWTF